MYPDTLGIDLRLEKALSTFLRGSNRSKSKPSANILFATFHEDDGQDISSPLWPRMSVGCASTPVRICEGLNVKLSKLRPDCFESLNLMSVFCPESSFATRATTPAHSASCLLDELCESIGLVTEQVKV
jgi:hypothetical protein